MSATANFWVAFAWMANRLAIGWLLALTTSAHAVEPIQPQPGLQRVVDIEVRLKSGATTVKVHRWTPLTINVGTVTLTVQCWNKVTDCPPVTSATVRLYLKLPWIPSVNITRYVLCNDTECLLPEFTPIQAPVGQAYKFSYDRRTARWVEPPRIVPFP